MQRFSITLRDPDITPGVITGPRIKPGNGGGEGAAPGRGETLALEVPSAVVPQECNLILNPRHAAFSHQAHVRAARLLNG